jgi:hypothetical protein
MIKIKTLGGLTVNNPLYAESSEVDKDLKDFVGRKLHAEGCPLDIEKCSWDVLNDKYLTLQALQTNGAHVAVFCTPFGCKKIGPGYIVKPHSFISKYGTEVF